MPFARVNETNLHYLDAGDGGPVLVLLHAFPLHVGMWGPQIEALAPHCRIIAPDARGLGGSSDPPDALTMNVIADDTEALLDHLRIGKAWVLGLSMGGYAAFQLYRQARAIFAGLVLADTRATADTAAGREGRERFALDALAHGIDWVADAITPKLLRPDPDPVVDRRVRGLIRCNTATGVAAAQRGLALRADSTGTLATIDCPTLVLVGEQDGLTPPADSEVMTRAIPASRLVVLPRAGHLSNLESAEAFNREVLRFVKAGA